MGWKESKQAFQYALPYEQVFQAAMAAVPMVPKAVLTSADVNARFITFDTPTSFTSYGENIVVGFIPSETGVIVEVTCATKGMPNLMQDGRNRKKIKQYIDGLSGILQVSATEVIPSRRTRCNAAPQCQHARGPRSRLRGRGAFICSLRSEY